jgi:hypothetical protein
MIILQFLFAWAVRSAILVSAGAIVLVVARLKAPSVRLAAWTTILLGSIATPILTHSLPNLPLVVNHVPERHADVLPPVEDQPVLPAPRYGHSRALHPSTGCGSPSASTQQVCSRF